MNVIVVVTASTGCFLTLQPIAISMDEARSDLAGGFPKSGHYSIAVPLSETPEASAAS